MSNYAPTVVMAQPSGISFIPMGSSSDPDVQHFHESPLAHEIETEMHDGEHDLSYAHSHSATASAIVPGSIEPQHRVQLACMRCRKQKLKCDGATPTCARCAKRNSECVYSNEPTGRKNGSKKKIVRRDKKKTAPVSVAVAVTTPNGAKEMIAFGTPGTPRSREMNPAYSQSGPNIIALEQLSRKLKMELDSYTTMAQHWQEQLLLLRKGGPDAVTDRAAVAALKREFKARAPKEPSGRPRYLPESRTEGLSWCSYTSESHPAIHLAHSMAAFSDRSLIANPLASIQDPSQLDIRCHRFRLMRFWDMTSPRELLTEDLNYETLVASWDILLQPISTVIQGNSFVDDIGRPLEDDLEETRTIDSIALFAHTAELEELLTVMEFGCVFFHATQLVDWDEQMHHLITNMDRLVHVAFFQRHLGTVPDLADRSINFLMWYVWRYKAFKMMSAYQSILSLAYTVLLSNFSHVSPTVAANLNSILITTSQSHTQMMHHVHLAERIPLTPLKKSLLGLAIGIVTLNRGDSQLHHYEKIEADYPELLRIIDTVENPFDPDNHAIKATALFLHCEVLVRLGRDIKTVEALIHEAIRDVVDNHSSGAIHLLFSNMFMFQATVNTVIQFSSGVTCTVSDYARIELAKALGFPLGSCEKPHASVDHSASPCKLKFGDEFAAALGRMGQLQPCDGTCDDSSATVVESPSDSPDGEAEDGENFHDSLGGSGGHESNYHPHLHSSNSSTGVPKKPAFTMPGAGGLKHHVTEVAECIRTHIHSFHQLEKLSMDYCHPDASTQIEAETQLQSLLTSAPSNPLSPPTPTSAPSSSWSPSSTSVSSPQVSVDSYQDSISLSNSTTSPFFPNDDLQSRNESSSSLNSAFSQNPDGSLADSGLFYSDLPMESSSLVSTSFGLTMSGEQFAPWSDIQPYADQY